MTSHRLLAVVALAFGAVAMSHAATAPVLVIHGGAGVIRKTLTPEKEALVRADLAAALAAGQKVLEDGGSSLDAVTQALLVLEDSPRFNAGKGAVFTHDGHNELDAAIMDGATLRAGAIAGVRRVRNPVLLARAVMEKSPHVMLAGEGAEAFARTVGIALVEPDYVRTEERGQQLQQAHESERTGQASVQGRAIHYGTVGAVALDRAGHLAAATSTGGMTNKRWGRIGDSPIIGAGTYADNASCAVSATGSGEYFIRTVVAHEICARVRLAGVDAAKAAHDVVHETLAKIGGDGGVIVVDARGAISMEFNTEGMFRAARDSGGRKEVSIY
jgi:beta-aspartyl-peptidase (threonine type)